METERIALIRDRARKNFSKGFNCAECVVEAVFEHVDPDRIACKAVNNKKKPDKKNSWEVKAIPEYAVDDCKYSYYVIIFLSDWTEMSEKIQNRLVTDVLFTIPDEEGKVKTFDFRAHSPMVRAFGMDYLEDEDGDDPLTDEVQWVLS